MSAPVDTLASPATAARTPPPRGWWRRNIWGLLALPVLAGGVVAINGELLVERNLTQQPRQPIVAAIGDPVAYGDARVRLVSLTQVQPNEGLVGYEGSLAPGLTIWQGVFDVDPDTEESLIRGCVPTIEDGQGRQYGNYPNELGGGRKGALNGLQDDLLGDLNASETSRADPYTSTSYFVLPTANDPASVRVVCLPSLPRYIRFVLD